MTQAEIARHLFLSDARQVRELRDRKVIPDPRRATLDEIRRSYIEYLRRQAASHGGEAIEAARLRRALALAEMAEAQAAKERGDTIDSGSLDRVVIALATGTSQRLQAIPAAVAPKVAMESDTRACFDIVKDEIWAALHALASEGKRAMARAERQMSREAARKERDELLTSRKYERGGA